MTGISLTKIEWDLTNGPLRPQGSCDRAIKYSGLGVRSVDPIGDFLESGWGVGHIAICFYLFVKGLLDIFLQSAGTPLRSHGKYQLFIDPPYFQRPWLKLLIVTAKWRDYCVCLFACLACLLVCLFACLLLCFFVSLFFFAFRCFPVRFYQEIPKYKSKKKTVRACPFEFLSNSWDPQPCRHGIVVSPPHRKKRKHRTLLNQTI